MQPSAAGGWSEPVVKRRVSTTILRRLSWYDHTMLTHFAMQPSAAVVIVHLLPYYGSFSLSWLVFWIPLSPDLIAGGGSEPVVQSRVRLYYVNSQVRLHCVDLLFCSSMPYTGSTQDPKDVLSFLLASRNQVLVIAAFVTARCRMCYACQMRFSISTMLCQLYATPTRIRVYCVDYTPLLE